MKHLTAQQLIERAVALQHAGDIETSTDMFLQVLNLEPKNPVANYSLAAIESGRGNYSLALNFIKPVLLSNPKFALAHLAFSIILFNLGELDKSRSAVEMALSLEPNLPNAAAHLDTVKMALESDKKSSPALAPEAMAFNAQAIDKQAKGDHEGAIPLLLEALRIAPDNFMSLYSLGVSLSATGRSAEALEAFTKACDTSPQMAIGHFAKAKTLQDLGLAEASIEAYDHAIEADPNTWRLTPTRPLYCKPSTDTMMHC